MTSDPSYQPTKLVAVKFLCYWEFYSTTSFRGAACGSRYKGTWHELRISWPRRFEVFLRLSRQI